MLLLVAGLLLASVSIPAGFVIAALLSAAAVFYYLLYFIKYRKLTDAYAQDKEFYFSVYSLWGVVFFNVLFATVFAFLGYVLDLQSPALWFGGTTYENVLGLFTQTVLDSVSVGLFQAFSWGFTSIAAQSAYARTFMYLANLFVSSAFLASLWAVIQENYRARQEERRILKTGAVDWEFFGLLSPRKARIVHNLVRSKQVNLPESHIVRLLEKSGTKESRDAVLHVLQSTKDEAAFIGCIDYFSKHRDRRFRMVCESIKDPAKRSILEARGILRKAGQRTVPVQLKTRA
ncbi:MAG: hypothetical protein ACYC5Y_10785 [Symbiobacteriia bacterium]